MNVYYWKFPPPLYRDTDYVMLPNTRILELETLIRYMGHVKKREFNADVYRKELYGADGKSGLMAKAISANPSFSSHRMSRDVKNKAWRFRNRSMFKSNSLGTSFGGTYQNFPENWMRGD